MKRQGINTSKTYIITLIRDGEPKSPGMAGVGSDVGTGNAEIYLVTANSFARNDTTCRVHITADICSTS
jgi:microcompartment protein CcmK/EutM